MVCIRLAKAEKTVTCNAGEFSDTAKDSGEFKDVVSLKKKEEKKKILVISPSTDEEHKLLN